MAGRLLKNDEIKEIAEKHQLDRMEIYNIRSQYEAMVQMSRENDLKEMGLLDAADERDQT